MRLSATQVKIVKILFDPRLEKKEWVKRAYDLTVADLRITTTINYVALFGWALLGMIYGQVLALVYHI